MSTTGVYTREIPAPPWKALTDYLAGDKVVVPLGLIGTRRTSGTSASSFTTAESANWIVGTTPGEVPVIKPSGDGRDGVIEWTHNDTTGYLLHLLAGSGMGHTQALIALGVDNDGIGLLVPNKKTGRGIVLDQQSGITAADAYGFHGTQSSDVAPMVRLETNATDRAALLQLLAFGTPGTTQLLYVGDPNGEAGRIAGVDGRILWQRDIRIRNNATGEAPNYFEASTSTAAAAANTRKAFRGAAEDTLFGATGGTTFWPYKCTWSASFWSFQTSAAITPAVAGSPRPSDATTFTTQISISHTSGVSIVAGKIKVDGTGIALFGGTIRAQPARAGQLTDSSGGTSGGNTIAAVTDVATAANAIATLAAKINAIEGKLSAAGTGIGVTA